MSLSQREEQSTQAYVREAEQWSKRMPVNKGPISPVAVNCGLRDGTRRHEISFAICGKRTKFAKAIDLTKAAYSSIGDSDPFGVGQDLPRFDNASP